MSNKIDTLQIEERRNIKGLKSVTDRVTKLERENRGLRSQLNDLQQKVGTT